MSPSLDDTLPHAMAERGNVRRSAVSTALLGEGDPSGSTGTLVEGGRPVARLPRRLTLPKKWPEGG